MRTDAPSRWFRMYAEFCTDPKVQMLSEADQRRYVMLLCLRCGNGDVTLHDDSVTFMLRITDGEWQQTKAVLLSKNLITSDNKPTAWEKRQYASDSSAERVSRHREKKKRQCNGNVTLQSRPVEAETEIEVNLSIPHSTDSPPDAPPPAAPKKSVKAARLPEDWKLPKLWGEWAMAECGLPADAVRLEADKFADYWRAKAGRDAAKLDWLATWRNWVRNAASNGPVSAKSYPASGASMFAGVV